MVSPMWFMALLALQVALMAAANQETCPKVCTCRNENKYIYCERKKLQEIPSNIPTTATELYLGYFSLFYLDLF